MHFPFLKLVETLLSKFVLILDLFRSEKLIRNRKFAYIRKLDLVSKLDFVLEMSEKASVLNAFLG